MCKYLDAGSYMCSMNYFPIPIKVIDFWFLSLKQRKLLSSCEIDSEMANTSDATKIVDDDRPKDAV